MSHTHTSPVKIGSDHNPSTMQWDAQETFTDAMRRKGRHHTQSRYRPGAYITHADAHTHMEKTPIFYLPRRDAHQDIRLLHQADQGWRVPEQVHIGNMGFVRRRGTLIVRAHLRCVSDTPELSAYLFLHADQARQDMEAIIARSLPTITIHDIPPPIRALQLSLYPCIYPAIAFHLPMAIPTPGVPMDPQLIPFAWILFPWARYPMLVPRGTSLNLLRTEHRHDYVIYDQDDLVRRTEAYIQGTPFKSQHAALHARRAQIHILDTFEWMYPHLISVMERMKGPATCIHSQVDAPLMHRGLIHP